MSEKFISMNPDVMNAGEFYKVYTNKDNATLLIPKDVEDTLMSDVNNMKNPVQQCWISSLGLDSNTGSISHPFKTIQHALNNGFEIINVLQGSFNEDLVIPASFGLYGPVIQGYGTSESPKAEIRGTISIPANVSRVRFKTLNIDAKGLGSAIIDNGSLGRHVLHDVTVTNAGSGNDLIKVINGNNWWNVIGSAIEGVVNLSGTGNNATFNIMYSSNSFSCMPKVNSGYSLTLYSIGKMGTITHVGGNIYGQNIGSWSNIGGNIINSTSINPYDVIGIGYSAFTQDGINYGSIRSNGATVIKNFNVESAFPTAYLTAVSIANTTIPTTPITLRTEVKKLESGISYNNTTGEITFLKSGLYNINIDARIECTEWDKRVDLWIEKYNPLTSTWNIALDSGLSRNYQNTQEVEINFSTRESISIGDRFRLRAQSDSATSIIMQTKILDSTARQPALRISISEVK